MVIPKKIGGSEKTKIPEEIREPSLLLPDQRHPLFYLHNFHKSSTTNTHEAHCLSFRNNDHQTWNCGMEAAPTT
jgi:hypothetical protein